MISLHRFCFILGLMATTFFAAGCNNTCVFGVVNPPNNNSATIVGGSSLSSVCSEVAPITGVTVGGSLGAGCVNCAASAQLSHVYLVVTGVELHPSAVADRNSPEWQEVAPELAEQPRLVDLVTNSTRKEEAFPLEVSGRIPAGAYYQVRLKLSEAAALPPETAELLRAKGCRSAARSGCVVSADGVVHELQTLDMQGFLVVQTILPVDVRAGRENRVQLRFHPEWVLKQSATGAIELAPLLEGEVIVRP
ncbi:MAG TPA: DUF4382 domain-containing protein [Candidatus Acidoferrum sp.]|nr:DUF4382 domain-containing protein [Candidatus Acidoferrum sp.]